MIQFIGIYQSSTLKRNMLNHGPIWEIMYCLEGHGALLSGDERIEYAAGDITVQPPNVYHRLAEGTDSCELYLMSDGEYPFSGLLHLSDTADFDIKSLLMLLYKLNIGASSGHEEVDLLLLDTIIAMIRMYGASARPKMVHLMENELIKNISNPNFRIRDMYEKLFMSDDTARAQFQRSVGCTPHEYLTRLRIQQACRLFEHAHADASITEVASRVGITDPQYFSRLFKQRMGMSPNAWIRDNNLRRKKTEDSE